MPVGRRHRRRRSLNDQLVRPSVVSVEGRARWKPSRSLVDPPMEMQTGASGWSVGRLVCDGDDYDVFSTHPSGRDNNDSNLWHILANK